MIVGFSTTKEKWEFTCIGESSMAKKAKPKLPNLTAEH